MTEKPEASVLTAKRAAQHFRLSSADDACEHLYILIVRSSLGPSPPNAGRYTVASRFRCRSCERGYIFPRAPEQFVTSPLCLVGYVRWDARSDRVPPLQTIIFSSFPGRTKGCRPRVQNLSKSCGEVADAVAKMACYSGGYTVVQRLPLSGIHAGVASSHWLSVNWCTSLPSLRMTNNSPYGWGIRYVSSASSLKPMRELLKIIHSPSGDQTQCASLPELLVRRRKPVPSGLMV